DHRPLRAIALQPEQPGGAIHQDVRDGVRGLDDSPGPGQVGVRDRPPTSVPVHAGRRQRRHVPSSSYLPPHHPHLARPRPCRSRIAGKPTAVTRRPPPPTILAQPYSVTRAWMHRRTLSRPVDELGVPDLATRRRAAFM